MNILKLACSAFLRLSGCIFGWLIIVPVAVLIPKRKDWVGVFGRQDGRFLDNAKYFFLQAPGEITGVRFVFVTERRDVTATISRSGRESYCYPSVKSIWFLLRCASFVVDEASWYRKFRFYLLFRANIIQLWHGVPFKWIELGLWRNQLGSLAWASAPLALKIRLFFYRLIGRRVRYAAVITTSEFYKRHSFLPFFDSKVFPVTGYPRNDFAQSLVGESVELAWSNVDINIKNNLDRWRRFGKRIVLVAPTFRDSGAAPMRLGSDVLSFLDRVAETNNIEFVFKFHPSEKNVDNISGEHFHICDRESDIYPVFPYIAALVTDYSSISMDFLLVDNPLLFLIPEDDDYMIKDRKLQFDPRSMMPGPIVSNWEDLVQALLKEWDFDSYRKERSSLRGKVFDDLPQSEAVPKLLELMREQGWIN